MDIIFINSKKSKASESYRLLLNLADKMDVALSNLIMHCTWQNIRKSHKNNKFKLSVPNGMMNSNYLTDDISFQIFKMILNIS